jgi:hypothetical protein
LLNQAHILDPESGHFVSRKHQQIAEVINDWNPNVFLVWIPPNLRTDEHDKDKPFAVMHRQQDGQEYIIFRIRENELDERVIARLWANDNSRHDVLSQIESEENARRAVALKQQIDEMEEAHDLAASILRSPKHTFRHNGIKFKD